MGSLRKAIGMQKQAASQMQKRAYAQEMYKRAYAQELYKRAYLQEMYKRAYVNEMRKQANIKAKLIKALGGKLHPSKLELAGKAIGGGGKAVGSAGKGAHSLLKTLLKALGITAGAGALGLGGMYAMGPEHLEEWAELGEPRRRYIWE